MKKKRKERECEKKKLKEKIVGPTSNLRKQIEVIPYE